MSVTVAYLRVSSSSQDVASQTRPVLELAARVSRPGDSIVTRSEKASGRTLDRPVWSRILSDCRARRVRCVVVWSLDRVGRQMLELLAVARELRTLGVELHSVREPWIASTGVAADVVLAVLGYAAELERERISTNTRAGLERVKREGSRSGLPVGRPRRDSDALLAVQWLAADTKRTVSQAAKRFKVSTSTIHRKRQALSTTDQKRSARRSA